MSTFYSNSEYNHNDLTSDGVNDKCFFKSSFCSSDIGIDANERSVCKWHHARMAKWLELDCDCRKNIVCCGDSVGRRMFRTYYNHPYDKPVVNMMGIMYCCGEAQNTDSQTHICGEMRVCSKHLKYHDETTLVKIEEIQDDQSDIE